MEARPSAWAFLRPLLLAVAVAAAWIALSAAGASADSSAHNDPLLAAAPPAVGAVTPAVTQQARDALEPMSARTVSKPAPAPPSVPPLQAAVKDATALADHVAVTAPVVSTVVPDGTVAAAVDPALGMVDRVVGGTVGSITPVTGAVLEPLAPALDPVLSAVPLPAAGDPAAAEEPTAAALPPVADVPHPGDGAPAAVAESVAAPTGIAPGSGLAGPGFLPLHERLSGNGLPHHQQIMHAAGTPRLPGADPRNTPFPGPPDGPPGTAAGGSSSSSGHGSGMPAWLAAHNLQIPEAGPSSTTGGLPRATPPVPLDPGSSPD